MNSQYRSSQPQQARTKKKEEDPADFMRLSEKEIASCISEMGIPFQPSDLVKPNPQVIQMVFEHLAEIGTNATRDAIDPAMRAASEDICAEFPELVPTETRLLMGFFVQLRTMLEQCGINDFSFNDLVRPSHDRLVKIFSYTINFVRFRETHTNLIDENFNKAENTKVKIETLYTENQDMEQRLEEMKHNRKAMEVAVKEKMRRNDELKARLLELRKGQERIAEQLERAKAEKTRAQALLEEKTERLVRARQESEKLRPYVLQSPAALQSALTELSENLMREKGQIDALERRGRALQTSGDSFTVVQNDVQACVKVLEEIAVELQKEEEEDARAAKNRDALAERGNNVREVEQNEKLLQRQLKKWEERTEELRRKHKERDEANKAKMDELRENQRQLRDERADKGREMERRRVRIEQTEKKMADLKDNIDNEVHSAHEEYLKLESHIKLYITEMEQSL
ncbi:kinetochore-associated Ndc80 complex subunit nuf2 [Exophiala xenobiotica]|uniref:Probable kinetochore protein NUF2 n=1 Tax=Vermiconidia calcicola TaxID=1690605 RepID=A0AAV9QF03_9PEZI|nr:kinetochore-associated Ndc80 complex subunit nuf2 [Exophiala xenobiotica]KAK5531701.1 kinetochore-associated Ndc80 complex subunit nuf2 [Chaetothyriales sp. CCFEE 6169]KAK5539995.1 kinetochore-associated Ndc80 complex subunit nuf2 [Vermiconidia calcicola]KAK5274578.1 kinetochore-associated Ndc80 complex subunit nuf2 [Exophiala xenobiotica]KAK5293667.1 kinetochore-associated Ndc80 complex subunit nuf2 [Exophiala xenobiotica]